MIISNTKTLKDFFDSGVEYTDPNCHSICNAIKKSVRRICDSRKKEIIELKKKLDKHWKIKNKKVENILKKKYLENQEFRKREKNV